jgi:predicted MFS family arabinose efflux permease
MSAIPWALRNPVMDPSFIAAAFTAVNAVRVVFYLPQIVAVARSVDGARDIALSTWCMWALTNALGTAYGAVVVEDLMLAASFALSLAACALTLVLAFAKRVCFAKARKIARFDRSAARCTSPPAPTPSPASSPASRPAASCSASPRSPR